MTEMKKKITAETLCELKFASEPRFSPDGTKLAFVVASANEERKGYKRDLWIADNGGARPLTTGGDAGSICWTPEGKILFPARRSAEDKKKADKKERFTSFYEIDPNGGEAAHAFTLPYSAGGITHIDGSLYLLTAKTDLNYPADDAPDREKTLERLANPPYRPIDEAPFWSNGVGFTYGTRSTLYIYDRAAGGSTRVTGEKFDARSAFAQDGKLYYVGSEFDKVRPGMKAGLYVYDIASGKTETILEPSDELRVMWARPRACGDLILAASKGEKFGLSESAMLYTLDPKSKKLTQLGAEEIHPCMNHVGSDARLGGGLSMKLIGDDLYYIDLRGYKNTLVHVDKNGGMHEDIAPMCGIDAFDICGDKLAYVEVFNDRTPEIVLNGKQITDFGAALADYEVSLPEYIGFTNSNGDKIDGWMLRPAGYDASKSYPALLEIHGGPRTAFGEAFFHEMQMFASDGYFVLFCNPRGSDGRGDAFADIWHKYGTIDYDDLMAFVDHALAVVPQIDKDKLGVLGGSYGGYMTNWIIGHTDRFKAACSQRSIASWVSFEFTSDIGHTFTRSQHRSSTHEDFDYLWDISPLKYANNAKTPTLFIHSDQDFRCWMVEGIQMFTALKFHNVDARLCLFEGENHELSRSGVPENRISRLLEMQEWFAKYITGEEKK